MAFESRELRVLSRLRSLCGSDVHIVYRSLAPRLEALHRALYGPNDGDESASDDEMDLLAVLSRRRHQETALKALLHQLQELIGESDEIETIEEDCSEVLLQGEVRGVLPLLLQAPRKSREVHWMHLQIDALIEGGEGGDAEEEKQQEKIAWQESWQEDYREQLSFFREFLSDEERLQSEVEAMEEGERHELLTSLQYERRKLRDAEDAELMPLEEQELLDHAVVEVARVGGLEVEAVPDWFVPRYEVRTLEGGETEVERVDGEWNGLQVTLEYEQDMPDLESFAEKWHGVTDPYVVKLHGACHVGSTPFVIYESLWGCIPLLDYTSGVHNTRKLWKRLLEVARGLQHLHNEKIVHGGISTACILIGSNGKAKVKPSVCSAEQESSGVTPSMESDVYAFAVAILEVVNSHFSNVSDLFDSSLSSIEEDGEELGGVNNAAWTLINSMTSAEPCERPDMTRVVRALTNLADRERTWSDMHFPELLLHAPDVWTALRAASQRHENGVIMCARVLARLEQVLARLWDEGLSFADGENVEYNWQTRTEHLIRSMRYLTRHYLPSSDHRELSKVALTRRFTDEIKQIHYQLDALLVEFDSESLFPDLSPKDETSSQSTEDWELQWEYDCGDLVTAYHKFLDGLEGEPDREEEPDSASVLKAEVATEAMALMKHELDNFRYAFSDAQLELIVRGFDICAQLVGNEMVLSSPEWFIPAYEVRDESWWEGVRVKVQRASEVFPHQNSRELCEVVLRQADIWSELVHPHIVELFGACHLGSSPFFVFECARGGSLKEFVTRYQAAFGAAAKPPSHLWRLLHEAALGLQYLHERDIVHEKLCCDNIVIVMEKPSYPSYRDKAPRQLKKRRPSRDDKTLREVAKLNGLQFVPLRDQRLVHDCLATQEEDGSSSDQWLAPERRNGNVVPRQPSLASDIYSFGAVIVEALTQGIGVACSGLNDGVLSEDEQLFEHLPVQQRHDAWELVKKMCAQQPELRPTISHVVQQLGSLAKAHSKDRPGSCHLREEADERTSLADDSQPVDTESEGVPVADIIIPSEPKPLTIPQVLQALNSQILESAEGENADISNLEASSGSDLNLQILMRLQDIYQRLCEAELSADEESDGTDDNNLSTIASDFVEALVQFRAHVNASRTRNRVTQIAAIRQRASDKFSFHKELDDLLERLHAYQPTENLKNSQIHDWKWQWYAKRARQTESFEWTLIKPEAVELLLDELQYAHDREEMLAFLRFEVTRHRSSYTPAQVEAIGATCTDISRRLSDPVAMSGGGKHPGGSHFHLWRPPKWFIPPYEVEFDPHESLGHGAFASVHMGRWLGTPVVIKKLVPAQNSPNNGAEPQSSVVFYRELSIWSRLNHPYVVKLYGGCHVGGQPFFVCEHASNGRLDAYLHRFEAKSLGEGSAGTSNYSRDRSTSTTSGNASGFSRSTSNTSSAGYSVESAASYRRCEAWQKLRQSALGLQYFHQHSIVHGDLKCDNILVAADGTAKLTDFGLSTIRRYVTDEKERSADSSVVGAQRWKAPECLAGEPPSFESDVYSFGMCVLQAVSGEFPWGSRMPDAAVRFHVRRGVLPPRPKGFEDDAHWDLIRQMCCFDPQQRLKLPVVVQRLTRFADLEARRQRGGVGVHMRELLFGGSATS